MASLTLKGALNVEELLLFVEDTCHADASGDVDSLFYGYHGPRSKYNSDQVAKIVDSFCLEVNREISKLDSCSKAPKVDFLKACKIARSIKARSIVIGAKNVSGACVIVIEACLDFDEESLSEAVVDLSNDFKRTKKSFETYLELNRKVSEKEKELGEPKN